MLAEAQYAAQVFYNERLLSPWPKEETDRKPRKKREFEINAAAPTDKCHTCGELGHWTRNCIRGGDLPSLPSTLGKKSTSADKPAFKVCSYCQGNHPSDNCFTAKGLMRKAGHTTSGRGGGGPKSTPKTFKTNKTKVRWQPKGNRGGKKSQTNRSGQKSPRKTLQKSINATEAIEDESSGAESDSEVPEGSEATDPPFQ